MPQWDRAAASPPVDPAVESGAPPDAQNRVETGCTVARCGRGASDAVGLWRISAWASEMLSVSLVRCGRHFLGAVETLADTGYRTILAERLG